MFVPIATTPTPSPRAKELGDQITQVIDEAKRQDPNLTNLEINQALRLATPRFSSPVALKVALMIGGMVFALVLGLFFFARKKGLLEELPSFPDTAPVLVIVLILGVMAAVFFLRRQR